MTQQSLESGSMSTGNTTAESDAASHEPQAAPRGQRIGARMIALDDLLPHPLNGNVMPQDLQAKLRARIERTDRYPFLVVRPHPEVSGKLQILAKTLKLGRQTKAIAIKYQHLPAVSTVQQKRENREFVVIGGDPEAARLRAALEGRGIGLAQGDGDLVVPVHVDTDTSSAERSTACALTGDRCQESDAAVPDQVTPLRGQPVAPLDAGVDHPDAVLAETRLDGHGEVFVGHGLTVA
jgi:hypothetical protein